MCVVFATPMAFCQPAGKLPEFEVASVKPSNPKGPAPVGLFTYPGGKVVASHYAVRYLLMDAFDIRKFQILGGPPWIDEDYYDVVGKPPSSSASIHSNPASFKSPPNQEQREMLQSLLIDRFHLRFHRESKQEPSYILERTGSTLKLEPPKDTTAYSWAGSPDGGRVAFGTGLAGKNISMAQLATRLSGIVGRPVVDRTGLEGSFDFEYRTGDNDPNADATATVATSLKHLGLQLKSAEEPMEIIVIDHIERPSEN
ncbi:TIGR03435 family protein [Edaphobacter dinghuensis]|uniref:Uncharacterized protein n=1 Tax=Edaphobacter dinghuensis TaxID=1560005 RepID=A0A917HP99_9BACT|nr:TIGR03435 family protein [Edaphobacter dinghuensis]GGG86111.1 hypothetical protein GCM10011585_32550 [Edaphobacter dinghuensis]